MPPNKGNDRKGKHRAAIVFVTGTDIPFDGASGLVKRYGIAAETAVNVIYGSVPFAVMMTTPADLEDFAYGFSFTEGIIDAVDDIRHVTIGDAGEGLKLSITLRAENMQRHLGRARNLAGRTGCGVCGIADLSEMPVAQHRARPSRSIAARAIAGALAEIDGLQALNNRTHAVHGAAFCTADGTIVALREDVGRHNALDKLAGHLLRQGIDAGDGFLLITSRASYEMVEKAARLGAPMLVAISAPTSLAIERAEAYGITLVGIARPDGAVAFTGADRILKVE